jgi:hypothetical protein
VGESVNEMTKDRMTEGRGQSAERRAITIRESSEHEAYKYFSTYCHNPGSNPLSLSSPPGYSKYAEALRLQRAPASI